MNVSQGILNRTDMRKFDPSKIMAATAENEAKESVRSFSHISPNMLSLANSFNCQNDPYYKAYNSLHWV